MYSDDKPVITMIGRGVTSNHETIVFVEVNNKYIIPSSVWNGLEVEASMYGLEKWVQKIIDSGRVITKTPFYEGCTHIRVGMGSASLSDKFGFFQSLNTFSGITRNKGE